MLQKYWCISTPSTYTNSNKINYNYRISIFQILEIRFQDFGKILSTSLEYLFSFEFQFYTNLTQIIRIIDDESYYLCIDLINYFKLTNYYLITSLKSQGRIASLYKRFSYFHFYIVLILVRSEKNSCSSMTSRINENECWSYMLRH